MKFIKSLLFRMLFVLWTAYIVVPFCVLWLGPRSFLVRHLRVWAHGVVWLLRVCVGINYRVLNKDLLPRGRSIIVCNHQSQWETMIFHVLVDDPCYVMKRILFLIPFFGQHAWRVGMIGIARDLKSRTKSLKVILREGPKRLLRGQAVIIFPEGTRVKVGGYVEYSAGAYALYRRCADFPELVDCPTVLVALNSGKFWAKDSFVLQPGTITIKVLSIVPKKLDKEAFMELLHTIRDAQKEQ